MKSLISFVLIIVPFSVYSQIPTDAFEEISRNRILLDHLWNLDSTLDYANLIRILSKTEVNFDELMLKIKLPNKIEHLIVQTDNVLDIGFFDACIKARVHQYGFQGHPFWAYDNLYGRANGMILFASTTEYALNQSDNLIEFFRFFLAQAAISSVMEHLGYWFYTNSSIPIIKNGDEIGWRGVSYPQAYYGKNDVPWMKGTPAEISNRIFFPQDEKGTIRKEAVFLSVPILYIFSYFVTPDKPLTKTNKFTKFSYFVYLDGVDYNSRTGLWGGTKLGLEYNLKPINLSFYSSYDLDARLDFSIRKNKWKPSITLGTNSDGEIGFYGCSLSYKSESCFFNFSYRKESAINFALTYSYII